MKIAITESSMQRSGPSKLVVCLPLLIGMILQTPPAASQAPVKPTPVKKAFHRLAAWGSMVPLVIAVIGAEIYSKAALYAGFYQKVATLKTRQAEAKDETRVHAPHA